MYCWRGDHYLVFLRGVLKYNGYSHERVYFSVSFQPSPQFHACFTKTLTIIVYLNFSLHAGFLQHINLIAFSPKIYVSLMFYPSNCLVFHFFLPRSCAWTCIAFFIVWVSWLLGFSVLLICVLHEMRGVSPFHLKVPNIVLHHSITKRKFSLIALVFPCSTKISHSCQGDLLWAGIQ